MNDFKDLGVKQFSKPMSGDKIEIERVLNRRIIILDYRIEPSKYPDHGNGKRLVLQIDVDNSTRIIFAGSVSLQDAILQIPREKLPFSATIIKDGKMHRFT